MYGETWGPCRSGNLNTNDLFRYECQVETVDDPAGADGFEDDVVGDSDVGDNVVGVAVSSRSCGRLSSQTTPAASSGLLLKSNNSGQLLFLSFQFKIEKFN